MGLGPKGDDLKNSTKNVTLTSALIAKIASKYSPFWNERDESGDCKLILKPSAEEDTNITESSQGSVKRARIENSSEVCIMCHGLVLRAGSDYFFKRLQPRSESGPLQYADSNKPGMSVLVEHVSETRAFEAMIRFLYFADINEELTIPELVQLLKVADRFGAIACCEAAIEVMLKFDMQRLEVSDINAICSAHPVTIPGWQELHVRCMETLLETYGKPQDVITEEKLLRSWCQLTWYAVRIVLTSDDLEADSEESVATVVQYWISESVEVKAMSDSALKGIVDDLRTNVVRFGLLSSVFFLGIVQTKTWAALPQRDILEVVRVSKEKGLAERLHAKKYLEVPLLWFTPRQREAPAVALKSEVEVRGEDLERAIKTCHAQKVFTGKVGYSKGWFFLIEHVCSRERRLCGVKFRVFSIYPIKGTVTLCYRRTINTNPCQIILPCNVPTYALGFSPSATIEDLIKDMKSKKYALLVVHVSEVR